MKDLRELQAIIQTAVDELSYPTQPPDLYEPISYILSIGGKRMRPALLLMACDLFGGDVNKAVKAALAIEVFHNFTLMHDDIMDKAPLRRGRTTVHERWNPNVAILSGDVMLIEGYKLMMNVENHLLPRYWIFLIIRRLACARASKLIWSLNSAKMFPLTSILT